MKKIIKTTKWFEKSFKKLQSDLKDKFNKKLSIFIDNEFNNILKTHELKWDKKWLFSFSVTWNFRAIYRKEYQDNREVIIFVFMDIWTHNQVY